MKCVDTSHDFSDGPGSEPSESMQLGEPACMQSLEGAEVKASFLNYLHVAGQTVEHFCGTAEGDTGPLCV